MLLLHGWPGDRTDYREVVAPPLPGIGDRILAPQAQREFWYQAFHNTELATQLVDGRPDAVRAYLRHFWSHWSGPGYEPARDHLDHLVSVYGPPGAFVASIAWYRAGAGSVAASLAEQAPDPGDRIAVPATVLWPEYDPLFPRAWSDRIGVAAGDEVDVEIEPDTEPREVEVPADLAEALAHDHTARASFDGLSYPPQGMGALDRRG